MGRKLLIYQLFVQFREKPTPWARNEILEYCDQLQLSNYTKDNRNIDTFKFSLHQNRSVLKLDFSYEKKLMFKYKAFIHDFVSHFHLDQEYSHKIYRKKTSVDQFLLDIAEKQD